MTLAASGDLTLVRRFPGLATSLARLPLTALPTPVHSLAALGGAHGIASLWVKRDDRSGWLYGGNKPRKLELVLGAARRDGYRSLLTFGALGSHHGLATAIAARAAGMRAHLVLIPQPVTAQVRASLLLDLAYGAELHYAPTVMRAAAVAARLVARGALHGGRPYIIPAGGSSVLGTIGYVNAGLELAEQVRAGALPEPAAAFVALGSGGTAAGLLLGLRLGGLATRVVAVLVTDILPPSTRRLLRMARACLAHLRGLDAGVAAVPLGAGDLTLVTGYAGERYGAATPEGRAAQQLAADLEGITLEPTYTAKCLAALLDMAPRAPFRDRPVLFWNTYSSIDPAERLATLPDFDALPAAFHRFFA